jgi:MazG family protein
MSKNSNIDNLLNIMSRLRDLEKGCPWDREQDFASISPYTIEEAYEVDDAIRKGDYQELKEELGYLLLQVVFHSRMAEEKGLFDFGDVCEAITEKMISRHPHVFGEMNIGSADEVLDKVWEKQKQAERKNKSQESAMDGVALALPALMRAHKLQKRAARAGFDWPDVDGVMDKMDEEIREFKEAFAEQSSERINEEFGDLLFTIVNLGRKLDIDPETELRNANSKFEKRYRGMEREFNKEGKVIEDADTVQMEEMWRRQKQK